MRRATENEERDLRANLQNLESRLDDFRSELTVLEAQNRQLQDRLHDKRI